MPATSSAREPEWVLLRAACAAAITKQFHEVSTVLCAEIRWSILFELADRHGVQPLVSQALFRFQELIPSEQATLLKRAFQTNLHKALLLSRELIRIVDRLSALGIEAVPYKGLALAETIYGDIALRQAGDIDLLIRAADLSRVRDALCELGYTPHAPLSEVHERAYLKTGYEYAFDGTAGPNLLEVQWAIQPWFYAVDFDMDALFRRAVTVSVAGYSMKTLCPEDLFVVLALHAAKHVWARLIWLCDLAIIMKSPTLNWKQIGVQAEELGIVRILRVTLLLANRVLGAPIPSGTESALPADSAALAMADEIHSYIASETEYNVETMAYFRLMLRLRENKTDQLRFLSRLVLTPGPGEWSAIQLPESLFPLYRLVRLSRVAARLVRT